MRASSQLVHISLLYKTALFLSQTPCYLANKQDDPSAYSMDLKGKYLPQKSSQEVGHNELSHTLKG